MNENNRIDAVLQQKLWDAAARGDTAIVRYLAVEDAVDFDAKNAEGRTPLNLATGFGHGDTAKAILAAKQFRYLRGLEGATPLPLEVKAEQQEKKSILGLFRRKKSA